jgi:hypothetical protein
MQHGESLEASFSAGLRNIHEVFRLLEAKELMKAPVGGWTAN